MCCVVLVSPTARLGEIEENMRPVNINGKETCEAEHLVTQERGGPQESAPHLLDGCALLRCAVLCCVFCQRMDYTFFSAYYTRLKAKAIIQATCPCPDPPPPACKQGCTVMIAHRLTWSRVEGHAHALCL